MKYSITALLFILCGSSLRAEEGIFPITPASEDKPAPDSVIAKKLGFFILDYGHPQIYGRPTNFWIGNGGGVLTQEFKRRGDGQQDEIRYQYDLAPQQFKQFHALLDSLRKDTRVLRARYGVPGEFSPTIAFSMSPHSDLYIREK